MSGYGSQQGRGSFGPPDGPVYQIEVVTSVGHSWSGRVERDLEDYFDRYGRPRVSGYGRDKMAARKLFLTFTTRADMDACLRAEVDVAKVDGQPLRLYQSKFSKESLGMWNDDRRRDDRDREPPRGPRDDHRYRDREPYREPYRDDRDRDQRYRDRGDYRAPKEVDRGQVGDQSFADEPEDTNARIYISNLAPNTTEDDLAATFGGLGQIAKRREKRMSRHLWPQDIKLYTNPDGSLKGDAVLTYEDPNAAKMAPQFFNGAMIKGNPVKVEMAAKKVAPPPPPGGWGRGGRGGRGGYGGGGGGGGYGGRGGGGYGGGGSYGGRRY